MYQVYLSIYLKIQEHPLRYILFISEKHVLEALVLNVIHRQSMDITFHLFADMYYVVRLTNKVFIFNVYT